MRLGIKNNIDTSWCVLKKYDNNKKGKNLKNILRRIMRLKTHIIETNK